MCIFLLINKQFKIQIKYIEIITVKIIQRLLSNTFSSEVLVPLILNALVSWSPYDHFLKTYELLIIGFPDHVADVLNLLKLQLIVLENALSHSGGRRQVILTIQNGHHYCVWSLRENGFIEGAVLIVVAPLELILVFSSFLFIVASVSFLMRCFVL
jgi:hypothetical protein